MPPMVLTRAQSVAQESRVSSEPRDHGKQPHGMRKHERPRRVNGSRRMTSNRTQRDRPSPPCIKQSASHQGSPTLALRGTKRLVDVVDQDQNRCPKRQRRARGKSFTETSVSDNAFNRVESWLRDQRWPQEYFESDLEQLPAGRESTSPLVRKRSDSGISATPSDQRLTKDKSAPCRDPRYELLLETKGSFMTNCRVGVSVHDACKAISKALLKAKQTVPEYSLFRDDIFESTCQRIHNRNEARIIQDIARLIVPSAESLATLGSKHLDRLVESVNERWDNAIPLTGTRPQPDYSVGFRREAFTYDQLAKLSPFLGNFIAGDRSFFMSTNYMYFPFLTSEVKCGAGLDVADRQNAHSMTLAVRGIVELFRVAKRKFQVDRRILAFSISHDHKSVRIYGHYPSIIGHITKYYRHPIHEFSFTALDGKEKWTAYRFTKNVYDIWMPAHFKRVCAVIDQLPSGLDFNNPSLSGSELSQDTKS